MSDVALFLEAPDQTLATSVADDLQRRGRAVQLIVVTHFPIADSLAVRFAALRAQFVVCAVFVSSHTRHSTWVLREMLMHRTSLKEAGERGTFVAIFAPEMQIPEWMVDHADAFIRTVSSGVIADYIHDQCN